MFQKVLFLPFKNRVFGHFFASRTNVVNLKIGEFEKSKIIGTPPMIFREKFPNLQTDEFKFSN